MPRSRRPSTAREARKVVTVVFADITGSTGLGEHLDPEALRSIMGRWFDAMSGVLERHGGSVEKFIGDAVVAVFGVPVVHEDDGLRAVRAAAEMTPRWPRSTPPSGRSAGSRSRCASASTPARSWSATREPAAAARPVMP